MVGTAYSSGTRMTWTALSRSHARRSGVTASEQTRTRAVSTFAAPSLYATVQAEPRRSRTAPEPSFHLAMDSHAGAILLNFHVTPGIFFILRRHGAALVNGCS